MSEWLSECEGGREREGLTDGVNLGHGGPTPDIAGHLAMIGSEKRLLLNQLKCREDISNVVEPADFG